MIRVVAVCVLASCSTDDGGPRLDAVVPAAAAQGAMAMLTGARLCGAGSDADCSNAPATIALGIEPPMVEADVVAYADTTATFVVPAIVPVGSTEIIVTLGDQSSNALPFEVLAP